MVFALLDFACLALDLGLNQETVAHLPGSRGSSRDQPVQVDMV